MTAIITCDRCNEKANMKALLPDKSITLFPATYWILEGKLQTWYSTPSIDVCPRCFEVYKQEIENTERRFMQSVLQKPDLRDVEHI